MTDFEKELKDFREFFETAKLPEVPFQLNKYMILHDIRQFVDSELQAIERWKTTNYGRDYLFRHLILLRELIEEA